MVEWLGPAAGLVEPAGALAVELAPSVGAFVGLPSVADEDGSGCHPPQPSPIDGEDPQLTFRAIEGIEPPPLEMAGAGADPE